MLSKPRTPQERYIHSAKPFLPTWSVGVELFCLRVSCFALKRNVQTKTFLGFANRDRGKGVVRQGFGLPNEIMVLLKKQASN